MNNMYWHTTELVVLYDCQEGNQKAISGQAGKGVNMDAMTKEEMQRFLNREAEKGSTEEEALKALADILGIKFPKIEKEKAD